jgi:phosphoglucomutase
MCDGWGMAVHPGAGKQADRTTLIDVAALRAQYERERPDPREPLERVSFGTSGHRGSAARRSFNEAHILAIVQAVCEHRQAAGVQGPLFLGKDSHALSEPAQRTAVEVLAAHGVEVCLDETGDTPTPVISHAILTHNAGRESGLADGLVITPSHNPPEDGGIKYNPPSGGPADASITRWIEDRANELLGGGVRRIPYEQARKAVTTRAYDFVRPYVRDLDQVIDTSIIRDAQIRIGVDPLGGASLRYWEPIAATHQLALTVVNPELDPTFGFMPVDHDGKIRMDCSSPYAMANLVAMKDDFDVAFGNDADADRHGIVTRGGLMNPNHYLAVAISYLFGHRDGWPQTAGVGKTLVSSGLIDRVAQRLGRPLVEVPVGFKHFVPGLLDGSLGFAGEESAGATLLRRDGLVWTTDKDGIVLNLLAAEIRARTGRDLSALYEELASDLGRPHYVRLDAPASPAEKARLKKLSPEAVTATELAGEPIRARLVRAPGNGEEIGGLKVIADDGWFAARPSGTEDVYKIYAESFRDEAHLARIVDEARAIVAAAMRG